MYHYVPCEPWGPTMWRGAKYGSRQPRHWRPQTESWDAIVPRVALLDLDARTRAVLVDLRDRIFLRFCWLIRLFPHWRPIYSWYRPCVCIYVCVYIYTYIYIYVGYPSFYTDVPYTRGIVPVCIYICMCVCMYIYIYIYTCIYRVCVCLYIYTHIYSCYPTFLHWRPTCLLPRVTYMHACIHTCIHTCLLTGLASTFIPYVHTCILTLHKCMHTCTWTYTNLEQARNIDGSGEHIHTVCAYIHSFLHKWIDTCMHMRTWTCSYLELAKNIDGSVGCQSRLFMAVLCVYACMCVYIYIHTHTYIYIVGFSCFCHPEIHTC